MGKNILDEYILRNKQIIILILGLPCSNKSFFAKELSADMKLRCININNYLIDNKFIKEKVNGMILKMYEHPDNYNWEELNKIINKYKKDGIILYGNYIDIKKINFDINFTFFINMNNALCKKILLENKMLPYEEDNDKVNLYFKNYLNPLYDDLKKNIKINKFFNMKEDISIEELYDNLWNILMELIQTSLKE